MSSLHSPSTTRRSTPSRRGRAGLAVAAVLATVTPLAAGCGAGFDSAALNVKPNAGAGAVGDVKVNNVWVIVDPSSGNAEVIGSVANTGSADLSWPSVQVDGSSAQIQPASAADSAASGSASGSATGIPAGQAVSFGQPGSPQIELSDSALSPGKLTQVTFTFGSAGTLSVTAQIQSNTGLFADYNPNAAASPSSSPSAIASASATSSASASASASESASATASASPSASAQ